MSKSSTAQITVTSGFCPFGQKLAGLPQRQADRLAVKTEQHQPEHNDHRIVSQRAQQVTVEQFQHGTGVAARRTEIAGQLEKAAAWETV